MDQEVEELKELVRQNIAISEDTNRQVHKVRRAARMGQFMQIVWWLIILGASGWAYYYYQPYINQITGLYAQFQSSGTQTKNWEAAAQEFLKKFSQPTPAAPQVPGQ